MTIPAGTRLGPYEVVAPVGAGGMGEVYRARDTRLGREIAVKILNGHLVDSESARRRFEQEARAVAALAHPNIVSLHDVGQEGGQFFVVTELLEGETLHDRLRRGPLPLHKLVETGAAVAEGLGAAHARGVVHRDLKPSNVFLTADGRVKVLDFGLARQRAPLDPQRAADTPTLSQTQPGTVLGTPGYMSPEQVRGEAVDARSDIFSLGCVLYEMATGHRAFSGASTAETLASIVRDEPAVLSDSSRWPSGLRAIVAHCLEKQSDQRFESARDVAFALRSLAGAQREQRAARTGAGRWWPAAALTAAMITGLGFAVAALRTPSPPALLPEAHLEQLTLDGGLTTTPAISRDGKMLAYASDRAGGGDLDVWVQQLAGGEPLALTDDPADDHSPDFSPDGTQVAFQSERDGGGVYVVSTLGGRARLIARGGRRPRFSPDGSRIAYWSGLFRGETDSLVGGMVDVAPTIMDILDLPMPGSWQGRSLFDPAHSGRAYLFGPYSGLFGLREGDRKLILDDASRKPPQLYDLRHDPHEQRNIASEAPEVISTGRERLAAWVQYQDRFFERILAGPGR